MKKKKYILFTIIVRFMHSSTCILFTQITNKLDVHFSSIRLMHQLVAPCQLGFLIFLCSIWIILFSELFEWSACKLAE